MHLWAMLIIIALAWLVRYPGISREGTYSERWFRCLFWFLFSPLSILSTAIAVLYMGCHGAMLGFKVGSWGCILGVIYLLLAIGCGLKLGYQGYSAIAQLSNYPQQQINAVKARIIALDLPYSGQIGFWQPELVLSQGLLDRLSPEHLQAVLAHEQAHLDYRDTFWFFWLGWIRSFSFWLPQTEALWQELLFLRELRADRKAAEKVDGLLLAESLLTVVKAPMTSSPVWCANFNNYGVGDRLNERINCLLDTQKSTSKNSWYRWSWLLLVLLPLLIIPLHY